MRTIIQASSCIVALKFTFKTILAKKNIYVKRVLVILICNKYTIQTIDIHSRNTEQLSYTKALRCCYLYSPSFKKETCSNISTCIKTYLLAPNENSTQNLHFSTFDRNKIRGEMIDKLRRNEVTREITVCVIVTIICLNDIKDT